MNTIKVKIARSIIKRKDYNEKRREKMVGIAGNYDQQAVWHFGDAHPGYYMRLSDKAHMYRKRAAWYVKKMIEKYVPIK